MVILQDLARFLQDLARRCIVLQDFLARSCKIAIVLQESCKITIRLARILQDNHSTCKNLARYPFYLQEWGLWFFARILQDNRSSCKILQDKHSSCKILQDNHFLQDSCKILQDNHLVSTRENTFWENFLVTMKLWTQTINVLKLFFRNRCTLRQKLFFFFYFVKLEVRTYFWRSIYFHIKRRIIIRSLHQNSGKLIRLLKACWLQREIWATCDWLDNFYPDFALWTLWTSWRNFTWDSFNCCERKTGQFLSGFSFYVS